MRKEAAMSRWLVLFVGWLVLFSLPLSAVALPARSDDTTPENGAGTPGEGESTDPEGADSEYRERRRLERLSEMKEALGDYAGRFRFDWEFPFLIGTDGSEEQLEEWKGVIRTFSQAMWNDYFPVQPDDWLCVFLYYNPRAYASFPGGSKGAGFFRPSQGFLVNNMQTGGGTLIHEMTHALHYADVRGVHGAPLWIIEAFGSLHEQVGLDDEGHLKGLLNWRLPILQQALQRGGYISWDQLMRMDRHTFGRNAAVAYAVTRYIAYYLQEQGKLREFYANYRLHSDRTGITSLREVLGRPLEEVEAEWKAWILTLRFEREAPPESRGPRLGISMEEEDRLVVDKVGEGTVAERAGILPGDRIVRFNGTDIETLEQLVGLIRACQEGQEVTVTVVRGDDEVTLNARF